MRKSIAISIVLVGALLGAYISMVPIASWAEENRYIYSSPLDYALDYLSDDIYRNIAIEVDWVAGRDPDWSAMDFLIERMHQYCEKDRIYIDHNASDTIISVEETRDVYTLSDLIHLEKKYRNLYKHGDTAVLYFLYLNGKYVDTGGYSQVSTEVAGLTYSHSSIAIFKDELRAIENPNLSEDMVEKSVLLHEFGHIICLVGIGYDSDQEDPEHPHHSIHEDGVMYYAINASEGAPQPPLDFCNASKRDIEFIKSRPRDISNVIYIPWLLLAADLLSTLSLALYILNPEKKEKYPYLNESNTHSPQPLYYYSYESQNTDTKPEEKDEEEIYF